MEEINAAGGINGRMLELVVEGSQCRHNVAGPAAERLTQDDNVKIILGPTCGGPMQILGQWRDIVMLSSSVGAWNTVNANENFFSTAIGKAQELIATDNVLRDDGNQTLATLSLDTDFARSLVATIVEQYESRGGRIVEGGHFDLRETEFAEPLKIVLSRNPDGLYVGSALSVALGGIIKQARELGYEGRIYGEFYGKSLVHVFAVAGEAAAGMRGILADFAPGDEKEHEFVSKFRERYGDAPGFPWHAAGAYDGAYMVAGCLNLTGDDQDVDGMRECLSGISFTGVLGDGYGFKENGYVDGLSPVVVEVLPEGERTEENKGYRVIRIVPE